MKYTQREVCALSIVLFFLFTAVISCKSEVVVNASSPTITTDVASSVSGAVNSSINLSIEANTTDGGTLSYQWYSATSTSGTSGADGTAIADATSASYTVPTAAVGTYYFYCVVTNTMEDNGDGGTKTATATSAISTVTVNAIVNAATPSITTQPSDSSGKCNGTLTLQIEAATSDGGTLSYQWYSATSTSGTSGVAIADATSASYIVPTATAGTYYFYCVVTNTIEDNGDGGTKTATVTSAISTVTVNNLVNAVSPTITSEPKDITCSYNSTTSLEISASTTDDGTLSYQWYSATSASGASEANGTVVADATSASYAVPTATAGTYYFYCVVTNTISDNGDGGTKTATATSSVATVIVNTSVNAVTPTVKSKYAKVTGKVDDSIVISVTANTSDKGALTYQWYSSETEVNSNGTEVTDATKDYCTVSKSTVGTYYYYCVVKNTISDNGDGGTKTATAASSVITVVVSNSVSVATPTVSASGKTGLVNEAITLEVNASVTDSGTLGYQWYSTDSASNLNGTVITEILSSASYNVTKSATGTYYYYCVVSNTVTDNDGTSVVTVKSDVIDVVVKVNAATPTVTLSNLVNVDGSTKLTANASVTDGGTLSYKWYSNTSESTTGGTEITGATNSSYTDTTTTAGTYYYYCEVTNTIASGTYVNKTTASTTSGVVKIVIASVSAPTVTMPVNGSIFISGTKTVSLGKTIELTATSGYTTYAWYLDGTKLSDSTKTAEITNAKYSTSGIHVVRVEVTDSYGVSYSATCNISITE